ncbi:MAG TPA: phosphodiester glycosidase family protein [Candidatus Baltobacteraceae bacterium]|nr:phosphodiester glycosidase family protein [Candidatus Baltobacteraceae bacterium]
MALTALLLAAVLPLSPAPAAPFPKIITDAPTIADVAPGVKYGDYQLLTSDGPISLHVIAVDLQEPTLRIGTALAQDRLISSGEPVSAMAHRTGAVAGINGDYFDINQTNQPLNILVQNGQLTRMPMHRWALAFDKNKAPQFAEFSVTAQAVLPGGVLPLKTLNDWPPPGGGSVLVTPAFGALRPAENVTEFALQLVDGTPPFATYRIAGTADNTAMQPPGYYLAIGPQAYGSVPLPNPGDTIAVQANATPALDQIVSAIGGGPLLVKDGAWYADPDGPNKGEFLTHMPASAAGITRDGTLLLFEVDGRQPALSIGVLQPQLASLMISFGVVTGMQFDGGGSSTIVARLPGQTDAAVQNSPSDGVERRVADALLVYSDAPYGPPAKIFATPQVIRALPGARVPLHVAITDAADHAVQTCPCDMRVRVIPGDAGTIVNGAFIAGKKPQDAVIRVQSGALQTDVPVRVTNDVARGEILPAHPALRARERLQLQARAFDENGYPIAVPGTLAWNVSSGSIDSSGAFAASDRDALATVRLGDALVRETVTVGEHTQPVGLRGATFATAPRGGPGGIEQPPACAGCLSLKYDFSGTERAAYINAAVTLPQRALGIAADVYGDGNGEVLRLAVNNAINERFLYTVATVDWHGWRHLEFRLPPALPQPIVFKSLYVINRVGPGTPVTASGAISVRNLQAILAGRADKPPK